jgi:hypothetical protein
MIKESKYTLAAILESVVGMSSPVVIALVDKVIGKLSALSLAKVIL